ncbi:Carboxypeptidase-like regulatory domain-containing protein [Desulfonema limicola]|uniref:Carboxypeptidase-like regulatory domain-containing protein n=1 Tax=Desulfonema limicola TaxID=45656 RepID=A0A975BEV2_9BACT|nr:carboxypeptidase-like regulatory domain-containing protein [Desulfonema limicola]QTA83815.1 Carboxypeptidase-like regulatory domain-containing protein [Desulfonema limicola]
MKQKNFLNIGTKAALVFSILIFTVCSVIAEDSITNPEIVPSNLYGENRTAILQIHVNPQDGIKIPNVRAEIIAPVPASQYPVVSLEDDNNDGIYKGVYTEFNQQGDYIILFYADYNGGTYGPVQGTLSKTEPAADDYEDDDTYIRARSIFINTPESQHHNFHKSGDSDWVMFYGISGVQYTVRVDNQSDISDAVIEIYKPDGQTLILKSENNNTAGFSNSLYWSCPETEVYFVKLYNLNLDYYGETVSYDLEVIRPEAGDEGYIWGTVTIKNTDSNIYKARIKTKEGSGSAASDKDGIYEFKEEEGNYTLEAELEGYVKIELPVVIEKTKRTTINIEMIPIGDINGDSTIGLADAILALQIISDSTEISDIIILQAEVNEDMRIGLEDAIYILRKTAGML